MRVDPAADEQVMRVAEVEKRIVTFLGCVAGVRGGGLVGDDEVRDEGREKLWDQWEEKNRCAVMNWYIYKVSS